MNYNVQINNIGKVIEEKQIFIHYSSSEDNIDNNNNNNNNNNINKKSSSTNRCDFMITTENIFHDSMVRKSNYLWSYIYMFIFILLDNVTY